MQIKELIEEIIYSKMTTNMIIATIESPPPALKLKYAENIIYPEQIYCSNYLFQEYHRDYKIKGIIDKEHQDVTSSDMSLEGLGPHKHQLISIDSTGNHETHGDIWFTDTLKKGDEVLVAIVGVFYVVVTKITKMPNKALGGV